MLLEKVKATTLDVLNMSEEDLQRFISQDSTCLYDPLLMDGMSELIDLLHESYKNNEYIVIDTDYDTDGIMSACVLNAALDVFGFRYSIYIPSMAQGYGLNKVAIDDMLNMFPGMTVILTADNGSSAHEGVAYAKEKGLKVFVTDHHLCTAPLPDADVIVNPNKPGDMYPFKGNAGATVAWKVMLAYATRYQPDKLDLINKLIVFAGIANVADVMPILDENHYIVKQAMLNYQSCNINTPYSNYNIVMNSLTEIINYMNEQRKNPLPDDETLFGFYLSPLLNAPRRVELTAREGFVALMYPHMKTRLLSQQRLVELNKEKSKLRDAVTKQLQPCDFNTYSNVIVANTKHGISGLIASHVLQETNYATIVFSTESEHSASIYRDASFEIPLSSSARSTIYQPLNEIIAAVKEENPDIILGGGGHAQAAGYTIDGRYLDLFKDLFNKHAKQIYLKYQSLLADQPIRENKVNLSLYDAHDTINISEVSDLSRQLMDVLMYQETLKPFGKDFNAQTTFTLQFNTSNLVHYDLNLNFWKTLKFSINQVDILTFNIELADTIKKCIADNHHRTFIVDVKLMKNTFNNITKPQLIMDKIINDKN